MDTEQYITSPKFTDIVEECDSVAASQDWLSDICFGVAFFCFSLVITLTTYYIGMIIILLVSLPLVTSPKSEMLKKVGAGALLGTAAVVLFQFMVKSAVR